jgi:hypothetical protein
MEEIKTREQFPESIYELADKIAENNTGIRNIVLAIQKTILDHAHSLPEQYEPKSIIESRFTPAEEAFEKGMLSCGARTNIVAAMLRHLGYEVKLIHGESKESVDHAWISVHDSANDSWIQYDLARDGAEVPSTNVVKQEVDSWNDIKDQIIEDHETLDDRKKARN